MEVPLELIYIRIRNGVQDYRRKSLAFNQKAGVVDFLHYNSLLQCECILVLFPSRTINETKYGKIYIKYWSGTT